ncbi:MAG: HAD-IC family P-type ATPase [Anaerolineae bacterium]|nr:HAD-IC family P-type ATPase [Anaerolineae bacterium]
MQIASNPSQLQGLSENEVIDRRARGQGNNVRLETSRSYAQIIRANLFTFINMVLFGIGLILVLLGLYTDAFLSVGIAFMNAVIGLVQEIRAKQALDKIALLSRPMATVIRAGVQKVIDPTEVVVGDILIIGAGDQIVVDGKVVGDSKIDVDESLLTGESDLIPKKYGDPVFSGSFCVNGSAAYEAEKVGMESVANKLTTGARAFRQVKTPLQLDVDFVIRLLLALCTAMGILFGIAAIVTRLPLTETAKIAAVVTGLIPNGLFFMISIAYAMGAVRMAGRGALIQQSNAVESMSNVNVLCLDKTGTLTANRIHLHQTHPISIDDVEFRRILSIYAASTPAGNRTSEALHEALKGEKQPVIEEVPFSSARKWSALAFDTSEIRGVYVMGALEMLHETLNLDGEALQQVADWSDHGLRVLVFGFNPDATTLPSTDADPTLPQLRPLGLISFSDELRPEADKTLKGFTDAGIRLKIISGDNPQTVAALAKQAGLPGDIHVVSGPELDRMSVGEFGEIAESTTVFGRITPQQKEKLVDTLRARGHYVAMIGDGVNDVLSLKKAHIGIAMQSGSQATRGVADIVLLNDSFAALPPAFQEGQRIVNGMLDIMRLFLTRVVYQTLIILGVAVIGLGFPITPVHMSLLSLFTVGIPMLALAAWSRPGTPKKHLIQSVLGFTLPAGLTLALAGLLIYVVYYVGLLRAGGAVDVLQVNDPVLQQHALDIARTVLTTVTTIGGLMLIIFVEPPTHFWSAGDEFSGDWRPTIMAGVLLLIYILLMVVPGLREFFELAILEPRDWLIITVVLLAWTFALRFLWRTQLFNRFLRLSDT